MEEASFAPQAAYDSAPRWKHEDTDPRSTLERLADHVGIHAVGNLKHHLGDLTDTELLLLSGHPWYTLRPNQRLPINEPTYRVYLLFPGRGWGKSHTVSSLIITEAMADPHARIGVVGPSLPVVKDVTLNGPSGILALCPPWFMPRVSKGERTLYFPNGAQCKWVSSTSPDKLRGSQFSILFLEELVAWDRATALDALDECFRTLRHKTPRMVKMGLPTRLICATTPKPAYAFTHLLKLAGDSGLAVVNGSTLENARNLDPAYIAHVKRTIHTTQGQQEFLGILSFADMTGRKVFDGWDIDATRASAPKEAYRLIHLVWDPVTGDSTKSAKGNRKRDNHGLAVVGYYTTTETVDEKQVDVWHADILHTEEHKASESPSDVAKRLIDLAKAYAPRAEKYSSGRPKLSIEYESNAGGTFVGNAIRQHDQTTPVNSFRTKESKTDRALAIQPLAEIGTVHIVGKQPKLEKQIRAFAYGGSTAHAVDDCLDAVMLSLVRFLIPRSKGLLKEKEETPASQ